MTLCDVLRGSKGEPNVDGLWLTTISRTPCISGARGRVRVLSTRPLSSHATEQAAGLLPMSLCRHDLHIP